MGIQVDALPKAVKGIVSGTTSLIKATLPRIFKARAA
jgi:hypothetical protein